MIYTLTFDQYKIGIIIDKYAIAVPKSGCWIINNGGIIDKKRIIIK